MMYEDYARVDAVNASTLKEIIKSPRHYQYLLQHPKPATPAMLLGTATHLAVLEPGAFDSQYIRRPDGIKFTTADGKAWRDEQIARGLAILDGDDYDAILAMRESLMQNPRCAELLTAPGDVEKSISWTDPDTGIKCKGRPDKFLHCGILLDLKTTKDVRPYPFTKTVMNFGYAFSMSFYVDGLRANGREVKDVYLPAVESLAPHDCAAYRMTDELLDYGRAEYKQALATLAECRKTGNWPGVVVGEMDLELPRWAAQDDDTEATIEVIE